MDDNERVGAALRAAVEKLKARKQEPEGRDVVMNVLATAADIERRENIQRRCDNNVGRPDLAKPHWPNQVVRTLGERDDAAKQRLSEIREADDDYDELRRLGYVSWLADDEIGLPEAIYSVFGAALEERSKSAERDMAILKMTAKNELSDKSIAASMNVSPGIVRDCKRFKAAAVWNAVCHLVESKPALTNRKAGAKNIDISRAKKCLVTRPRSRDKNHAYFGRLSLSKAAA